MIGKGHTERPSPLSGKVLFLDLSNTLIIKVSHTFDLGDFLYLCFVIKRHLKINR